MKFSIWQCPWDQAVGFLGPNGLFAHNPDSDYEQVWEGDVDDVVREFTAAPEDALDIIFAHFQRADAAHMPPEGYEGRSMAAGDLVCLDERWYFCALEGWEKVS